MEHVQGAVQQVLASHSKFDVRANTLTLIAITGVIIFWRGIWTMWYASPLKPADLRLWSWTAGDAFESEAARNMQA